ncbi:CYTH domain-containing protein [Haloflavibacter putidus]|nr:CYTH domain-containing protein [Haloflavibacter putidus]
MQEIERKYLVKSNVYKELAHTSFSIIQAYLNSHPERTTRIRTKGEQAFITVKGKSSADGASRFEWEKEIELSEAKELLKLCEKGKIEKTRFLVKNGNHTIEVDEFYGNNKGLTLAEIELNSADESINVPDWLGKEVTGKPEYYNSAIAKNPYKNW